MVRHHPGSPRLPRPSPASRARRAELTLGWERSEAGAEFGYLGMGQCVTILPFRRPVHPLCTALDLDAFHLGSSVECTFDGARLAKEGRRDDM